MVLNDVKTCELVEELKKRDGVEAVFVEPYEKRELNIEGHATVLIVID